MDYLLIIGGLLGLFLGGEALVRGSIAIATRLSLSPFVIGVTVVGVGTSLPELLVSVQAALGGVPAIAVGNVVGSNIANVLLILGLCALIWPIRISTAGSGGDLVVMLAATLILWLAFFTGALGRGAGGLLLVGLVLYVWHTLRTAGPAEREPVAESGTTHSTLQPSSLLPSLLWVAAGLVALVLGARFLIAGAVSVAQDFGLSEAFIGLSIVAVGTSLPELATSLVAALRRQSDVAIGNVLGSNIFNLMGILGVTALIAPIPVDPRFATFDMPVAAGAAAVLAGALWWRGGVSRPLGLLFLLAYGAYVTLAL